jgi:hypothetical protein
MFRSIIGFALLAIVAWLGSSSSSGSLAACRHRDDGLTLAVIGFFFYMALRIMSVNGRSRAI